MNLDLDGSKRLLWILLTLGCSSGESPDDASAADAVVCEGDHFVGDAATLAPLIDCTHVSGELILTGNDLDVVELSALRSVDGNLSVWGNPNLTEVKLTRLARVGGYFLIEANDRLTRLDIPALASVNESAVMHHADVSISGNPQLPTCQASAVRDQLLARGFAGSVQIADNLGTCSQ